MKALVYTGPQAMELREVTQPSLASDADVLIKVEACGICGSDMHAWNGHDDRRPAPLILGHEAAGTIVEGQRAGTRVTVNPLVTCQTCEACRTGRDNICSKRQIISMPPREGAFAEYLTMPERNLVEVPDTVASEIAALTEPLACGWHAMRLAGTALHRPLQEARTLVLGGGAIGLGAALVLSLKGAREIWIAETNTRRHDALTAAGNFKVFDPRATAGPEEASVDLVIDAVGFSATRTAACRAVKSGGVIVHIGLGDGDGGLDVRRMTLQEIVFIGTYTYSMADFQETAAALFNGELGATDWIDVRPLTDGAAAFQEIDKGLASSSKIVLKP